MKYRIKYDYHTHTTYSHGKGTIEDNVRAAAERGLAGIALSDHGPGHLLYGIDRKKIPDMRSEIEGLRDVYYGIDIFLSVEANILNIGNCLDLRENEFGDYDFIIAGYHYGVRNGRSTANFMNRHIPAGKNSRRKLKNENTDMAIRAIYENPVRILTHPGDKGPFDITEIAHACANRGTLMEINDSHEFLTPEGIRQAAVTDVMFIINSDAHSPEKIGNCSRGIQRALEAGLDMCRIVNIEEI